MRYQFESVVRPSIDDLVALGQRTERECASPAPSAR